MVTGTHINDRCPRWLSGHTEHVVFTAQYFLPNGARPPQIRCRQCQHMLWGLYTIEEEPW